MSNDRSRHSSPNGHRTPGSGPAPGWRHAVDFFVHAGARRLGHPAWGDHLACRVGVPWRAWDGGGLDADRLGGARNPVDQYRGTCARGRRNWPVGAQHAALTRGRKSSAWQSDQPRASVLACRGRRIGAVGALAGAVAAYRIRVFYHAYGAASCPCAGCGTACGCGTGADGRVSTHALWHWCFRGPRCWWSGPGIPRRCIWQRP